MDCCHTNETQNDSHTPGMGHGSAAVFLRRFWIVTALLVPLVLVHPAIASFLGYSVSGIGVWVQLIIATIIFGFSLIFFQHALHEIRARAYGMMTLVSLAVGVGYLFSVVATFVPALDTSFYLEISTLIWVLLFGHYLEARSSSAAGNALDAVTALLPQQAHRIRDGAEEDVPVADLAQGDQVRVKPGEKIPADGEIVHGAAQVDESLVSGESTPIAKEVGDTVLAGSVCLDGSITIVLTHVGEQSTVGHIKALVARAAQTKPNAQRIADRAAGILTAVALGSAIVTFIVWTAVIGESITFAISLAITVLVIACPHALGLAIPTVTTITTARAVANGFFIKDLASIERIKNSDYVVFDKTGTLTTGEFGVRTITTADGIAEEEVIRIAASLEQYDSHSIAYAIQKYADTYDIARSAAADFKQHTGEGIVGTIDGAHYHVGNKTLLKRYDIPYTQTHEYAQTTVFVADDTQVLGVIELADTIKPSAYTAIKKLQARGIAVALLTGDTQAVADTVAHELGITTVFAEVAPGDKYAYIQQLQHDGHTVLMVGDGINDAPALTQADAGIAIGAGTDVAVEAGDIILTNNDPAAVVQIVVLAKKVYRKMIQNLMWALGYNVIAIPAAAGVFAAWGFFLRPEIGALVMSLSTVIVVVNALTLKRTSLTG